MRYFLVVLRGVFLEGTPFHLLITQFWPLAVIGTVTLIIAGWLSDIDYTELWLELLQSGYIPHSY